VKQIRKFGEKKAEKSIQAGMIIRVSFSFRCEYLERVSDGKCRMPQKEIGGHKKADKSVFASVNSSILLIGD
jgi:uncharacterized PurR-regulated membrane protein YhhQ (DUF165 family)